MIENSVILSKIFRIYENSRLSRIISYLVLWIVALFESSNFIGFIFKESKLSINYQNSILYKLTRFVTGFLIFIFKKLFSIYENTFQNSMLVRLSRKLLNKFEFIAAISMFILLIVPDKMWYNVYGLVLSILLFGLLAIRTIVFPKEKYSLRAMDFAYVLFFITAVLAAFTSVNFDLSSRFLVFHFTCFLFVLVITAYFNSSKSLATLLNGILFGILAISLYGIWQGVTHSVPFDPSLTDMESNQDMPGRVYATMGNPNNYAEILVMAFPFCMAVFLNTKSIWIKVMNVLCVAAICGALLYTGSRSLWIAFVLSIFILLLFKRPSWIPVFIVLGIAAIPLLPDFIIRRIMTIGSASTDSSALYRVKIYKTVLPMIKDYWFTGIGLGTNVFMKISENYELYTKKIPLHTHILYTQVLLEAGIIGLVTFLWTIGRAIKNGIIGSKFNNPNKSNDNNLLRDIHIAGVASICSMLPVCFLEYIWYYPRVMVFFWIVMAILMAAHNTVRLEGNTQK